MKTPIYLFLLACVSVSASANTYIFKPIERIPAVDEITVFSNGKPPATGERILISRESIIRFLAHGTPVRDRKDWVRNTRSLGEFKDGVFFDSSGRAYFWSLQAHNVLLLETENGESIQIILKEE